MHAYYDVDGDGLIAYEEFVSALSDGKLSQRKTALLEKLWSQLDSEGAGKCKGSDVVANLKDGEKHGTYVLGMYCNTKDGNQDGTITQEEWMKVWTEISTQYPNDASFNAGIQKYWNVGEDADAALDDIRAMHLLGLMRQRLITKANGQQEEYALRDMFRAFDSDGSGNLSVNELAGLLSALGVTVQEHELTAMMRKLDTSNNGVLEFEEFQTFLLVDPYKKYEFS